MCFDAVDKVMNHTVTNLIAQLVVVHKDVTHCLSFQQLVKKQDSVFHSDHFHTNRMLIHLCNRKKETKKNVLAYNKTRASYHLSTVRLLLFWTFFLL